MKKIKIVMFIFIIILLLGVKVNAHGGNVTGWKDKNSNAITECNGKYYGYHNENGVRHYHEVEWDEANSKWQNLKTAVYYDENFNVIDNGNNTEGEIISVKYISSVDGDTAKFEINGETATVRFLGIDTPETVHPNKEIQSFGKEASDYTKQRLESAKKIEIELDNNADKFDKYERYLAWIWVDGSLLQEELVKKGLAECYMLKTNYRYAGVLQTEEGIAKSNKVGKWGTENSEINSESEEQRSIDIEDGIIGIVTIILAIVLVIVKKKKK